MGDRVALDHALTAVRGAVAHRSASEARPLLDWIWNQIEPKRRPARTPNAELAEQHPDRRAEHAGTSISATCRDEREHSPARRGQARDLGAFQRISSPLGPDSQTTETTLALVSSRAEVSRVLARFASRHRRTSQLLFAPPPDSASDGPLAARIPARREHGPGPQTGAMHLRWASPVIRHERTRRRQPPSIWIPALAHCDQHTLDVKPDGLADCACQLGLRSVRCNTSRQVGYVGLVDSRRSLDDDGVSHQYSPPRPGLPRHAGPSRQRHCVG